MRHVMGVSFDLYESIGGLLVLIYFMLVVVVSLVDSSAYVLLRIGRLARGLSPLLGGAALAISCLILHP